ncbi:MAG: methyltransferase domain-containing protein [Micromonosporaceae bacterium]
MAETWWRPVSDAIATLAQPDPGAVLVDLGCGDGVSLAATAARVPSAQLIGLDLRADAMARAQRKLQDVSFVVADLVQPLPLADRSVDVVICHNVLELLPDPAQLVGETARALRPGGRAVFSHTDFAGLVIHGADEDLTTRICHAYSHIKQAWMPHIDPRMARRLPGLVHRSRLRLDTLRTHVLAATRIDGHAAARVDEITQAVRSPAAAGATDLTEHEIDTWRRQLATADQDGDFCFAETAFLAVAAAPAG